MSKQGELALQVVGASTAGLFAAWRLAAKGWRVVVYERQETVAPRTLIVTSDLRRWWPNIPPEVIRHRITGFDLRAGSIRRIIPLREPDWVIERAEVRAWLAQLAQEAGAEVRWGWTFVRRDKDRLIFRRPDGEEQAEQGKVVLAADGVHSSVVRAFGLSMPPRLLVLQARVRLPSWASPERAVVWWIPENTRYFYWLIPESFEFGVLGLVTELSQPIRRLLDQFLDQLGLEPLAYEGGQVAAYWPGFPFQSHREGWTVFRIGDAGGQVKVTTVGGTVTGLWGAAAVAEILHAGRAGWARELTMELIAHWLVRRILDRFSLEDYERLLLHLNRRAMIRLGTVPRDRWARGLVGFLLAQPAWAWLALRSLLR
ncbi:NAD(P)/FAD-dependent oxidoreductase [Thermoflexus sp.]|uniref:NAD(P)/FAD-dependent oxidoreductase n=1 Tax=Thermoflexus sp. TaxID=1969742 RepID=UPI002ADE3B5D|nr:NAD(P)/FAD-dependent oxidoreductase [Thermoflexus sp.]